MLKERSGHSAAVLDDKIYAIGQLLIYLYDFLYDSVTFLNLSVSLTRFYSQ